MISVVLVRHSLSMISFSKQSKLFFGFTKSLCDVDRHLEVWSLDSCCFPQVVEVVEFPCFLIHYISCFFTLFFVKTRLWLDEEMHEEMRRRETKTRERRKEQRSSHRKKKERRGEDEGTTRRTWEKSHSSLSSHFLEGREEKERTLLGLEKNKKSVLQETRKVIEAWSVEDGREDAHLTKSIPIS